MKITVIDSIMGSGKTQWAIQLMNEDKNPTNKYLFVTPFLDEVERVITNVTTKDFFKPETTNPDGTKLRGLKDMVKKGLNIVTTHSNFGYADDELYSLLKQGGYILILDEVMQVLEKVNIHHQDIPTLTKEPDPFIRVLEGGKVEWLQDNYNGEFYKDIKLLAKAGNLYYFQDKLLLWAFPPKIFDTFKKVYILTYLFPAQIQRYYYDLYNFEYDTRAVKNVNGRYELAEYDITKENRQKIMDLINLYEGKYNDIGNGTYNLSGNWLTKKATKAEIETLRKNTYSFFRTEAKTGSKLNMWTTIKEAEKYLKGGGYTDGFTPVNLRATNKYREKVSLAYLYNKFLSFDDVAFFAARGVTVREELFAVSELLQWVWRSRIREGEPINLYLPSKRMRTLLKDWGAYKLKVNIGKRNGTR